MPIPQRIPEHEYDVWGSQAVLSLAGSLIRLGRWTAEQVMGFFGLRFPTIGLQEIQQEVELAQESLAAGRALTAMPSTGVLPASSIPIDVSLPEQTTRTEVVIDIIDPVTGRFRQYPVYIDCETCDREEIDQSVSEFIDYLAGFYGWQTVPTPQGVHYTQVTRSPLE